MTLEPWSGTLWGMVLRCLLVDDSTPFLAAASKLLRAEGLAVVGVASTGAEARARVRELEPDVTIVDVNLDGESGFDVAWDLAESSTRVILTSTHSESDLAELVAVTPVLGFISKNELSAGAIRDFLADCSHGRGCRHEALVYSSTDELAVATLPFMLQGLARGDHLLVVLWEAGGAERALRAAGRVRPRPGARPGRPLGTVAENARGGPSSIETGASTLAGSRAPGSAATITLERRLRRAPSGRRWRPRRRLRRRASSSRGGRRRRRRRRARSSRTEAGRGRARSRSPRARQL